VEAAQRQRIIRRLRNAIPNAIAAIPASIALTGQPVPLFLPVFGRSAGMGVVVGVVDTTDGTDVAVFPNTVVSTAASPASAVRAATVSVAGAFAGVGATTAVAVGRGVNGVPLGGTAFWAAAVA
jgi:hypothetical protein